jgi:methylenetetrahydrofolate--tRNA-(uracil-5-)-methyltransferase
MTQEPIHIVGAGMAGSEAAWQAARAGVRVVLHEMRPLVGTDAHRTDRCAELVCSNSFRSDDAMHNAVGLLHEEMRRAGSLVMAMGDRHRLPAGGALAVDRDAFAEAVTAALEAHPNIEIRRAAIEGWPPEDWARVIVATGPLTHPALAEAVRTRTGEGSLAFFDAIAPIVHADSIDLGKAWFQSRYDKGETEEDPPPISTARWTGQTTTASSTRSSRPRSPSSANGNATPPISRVACPSRSWQRAGARRCVSAR